MTPSEGSQGIATPNKDAPAIVIADASNFARRNLAMLLQSEGYNLLMAGTAAEVVSYCVKHQPDLVLMDIDLPDSSGLEVCSVIKKSEQLGDVIVVLMAAREHRGLLQESVIRGARTCLFKPLESRQLLELIATLLSPLPRTGMPIQVIFEAGGKVFKTQIVTFKRGILAAAMTREMAANGSGIIAEGSRVTLEYQSEDRATLTCSASIKSVLPDVVAFNMDGELKREQKRRFFRKAIELKVRYLVPGQYYRLARTADISGGGCRLLDVGVILDKGLELPLTIYLTPKFQLNLTGRIEWYRRQQDGTTEVGCSFLDIHPEVQMELVMFLFDENWTATPVAI